ncbi:MAG TPA: M20/M25/M40 family metallo-hydrolase [Steroidobacteraceae bacterium]|nr:M20/M25/M40 family metallo-hydrolase [Steroidobacteraceae bacterium]
MKKVTKFTMAAASAFLSMSAGAADKASHAQRIGARCWDDVRVLSADNMEGRRAGSPGHRRAAEFVAENFEKAGLKPGAAGGYLQVVRLETRQIVEANSSLRLLTGGDARPLKFGDDAGLLLRGDITPAVEAPLVFVGHGLVLPQYGVDDLRGLDLKGKIVVAFLAAPASVPASAGAHFGSASERWKIYKAAGAVGVLFIPNPHGMDLPWERAVTMRLEPFMVLKGGEDLYSGLRLWVMLNPARFPMLLEGTPHNADELLALLKDGKPLPHFDLPARISATVNAKVSEITSENVVGVLPGSDAALRDEFVVLTAHLDHLGIASEGQADDKGDRLFNGAMDNASGIAVMMQMARELTTKKAPRRSIVFAAVTAEELGLLGSRAFVADAQARGQRIVANINTDMFMPLYPMKQLVVFGLEESDLAGDARAIAQELGIAVQTDPQPQRNRFIRSDQYSFIRAGIPALATKIGNVAGSAESQIEEKWFTERYHAVSDSADQPVDLAAVGTYAEFMKRLAVRVANRKVAPRWHDSSVFSQVGTR